MSYIIVAIIFSSPAIYYRMLWKKSEKARKLLRQNQDIWEWWRE